MANATDNMPANAQKYEGPGKIFSAINDGTSWAIGAYAIAAMWMFKNKSAINERTIHIGSALVGVIGGALGYGRAAKGEKQFESMKSQLAQSQMHVAELQTKVVDISREAASNRKSFAHHVDSRSANGSHASAVDADKAVAATAEAAR